ncbi:MAG: hypothetical protein WCE54_19540 [Ignavibacteriaceae bacterium]
MIQIDNRTRASLEFVVNELKSICIKKNFSEGAILCSLILFDMNKCAEKKKQDNSSYTKQIHELIDRIYNLADDIKFVIDIERRYILFPLPDIKKEAYEMGKKYMSNFLEWVQPEDTPEKIAGILEEEAYRLNEMKKILVKVEKVEIT